MDTGAWTLGVGRQPRHLLKAQACAGGWEKGAADGRVGVGAEMLSWLSRPR